MSDHFSGPRAVAHRSATSATSSPSLRGGRPANFVFAMDVVPLADASSKFSAAVVHRFHVLPAEVGRRAVVPGTTS